MNEQAVWRLDDLRRSVPDAVMLVSPSVRSRVTTALPYPVVDTPAAAAGRSGTLVAIGGGTLLDEAKLWRWQHARDVRLVAGASIWGSGAEASRIAVVNRDAKEIFVDDALRPDVRLLWPELGHSVPPALARAACGDAMSHAFEALVSPVASAELRATAGRVLNRMLDLPLAYAPEWFDASANACALQAASSVGLVHGIAHVLEMAPAARALVRAGHAALCATYLLPVYDFDAARSDKVAGILDAAGVSRDRIRRHFAELHDRALYQTLAPALSSEWPRVIRDRCSRTNPVLVRSDSLSFFQSWTPA